MDAPTESIPGKRKAPQDAYGIRCAPQVHGAVADGLAYAEEVLAREVDAATDNPLVFGEDVLSGGNFHAEPVALAADHLKLCVHELGSISERRTATLVDAHMNEGLPAYLAPTPALHSGFMLPQYVAAAIVSENKVLCHPASADSIPTGANIEDHVSMGTTAAKNAMRVADNVHTVLAIECMAAAQAIELRDAGAEPALGGRRRADAHGAPPPHGGRAVGRRAGAGARARALGGRGGHRLGSEGGAKRAGVAQGGVGEAFEGSTAMSGKIEPRTLKGFRDTMPDAAAARNRMFRAIEAVFESFGYVPIDTPALEYAEVLKGKGGDESDKQMFEFDDPGGRRVAMRFDLTVPAGPLRRRAPERAALPVPPLPHRPGLARRAPAEGPLPRVHAVRRRPDRARRAPWPTPRS